MTSESSRSSKPHLRRLRVEPYRPQEFLPGLTEDHEVVDVSRFTPYRYVVTFEMRTGWRKKWRKVVGYA